MCERGARSCPGLRAARVRSCVGVLRHPCLNVCSELSGSFTSAESGCCRIDHIKVLFLLEVTIMKNIIY